MNIIEFIAEDVFDKVRGRFTNLEMGDETGTITTNPKDARFFDFDFVVENNNLGRVSISINQLGTLKIFYSQGITEDVDSVTLNEWYEFLREMRYFAKRRMLRFDTRDISKSNLNKNDFQYLAQAGTKENNMNESAMIARGPKTSMRKLENTRLIVRHSKEIDETQKGARSRNINALFVENSDGERFKYPFIHLAGAKAMQRHVANGGRPYDDAGKEIISLSEKISQLVAFKRHVGHHDGMNQEVNEILERSQVKLNELRKMIESLSGQKYYEQWMSELQPNEDDGFVLDQATMEDYKDKFTQKNFKEDLTQYFPLIHKIMQEAGEIDLTQFAQEEQIEEMSDTPVDDFVQFESWAESVTEGTLEPDAIMSLKDLLDNSPELNIGPDGTAGIEALEGIGINVEALENLIQAKADLPDGASTLLKDVVGEWLSKDDPEAAEELFGQPAEPAPEPAPTEPAAEPTPEPAAEPAPEPAAEPAPAEPVQPAPAMEADSADQQDMDNEESKPQGHKPSMKEIVEFIKPFYNKHASEQGLGEWRKGPTELGIMAGKQFGDHVGKLVEKYVERMQQQTETMRQSNQQFEDIMQLAGLQKENAEMDKIPAFIRKQKQKSQDTAQNATDKRNEKTGAKVWSSKRANEDFDIVLKLAGISKK